MRLRTKRPDSGGRSATRIRVRRLTRNQNAVGAKPPAPGKLPSSIPSCDRLSSLDNFFLLFEGQNTHMHVAITAIFEAEPVAAGEGGVDIERIRAFIASRLHRIPRYRQRLSYTRLLRLGRWKICSPPLCGAPRTYHSTGPLVPTAASRGWQWTSPP